MPVVLSNCSNNYGPWQFPEKFIPLMVVKAARGEAMPVYGRGDNVRDWLQVDDHAHALWLILTRGRCGESYNVGGRGERRNLDVVGTICDLMDELAPERQHRSLIRFVADRPGHDLRYAVDFSKLSAELGWQPRDSFEAGLRATVRWYLDHRDWWDGIGHYRQDRLGVAAGPAS